MNLGQAAAVVMYEMARGEAVHSLKLKVQSKLKRKQKIGNGKLKMEAETGFAEMETVERIGEGLLEALRKSGYIAARGEATAGEKLRRMLRRFSMESADAKVFLGIVRKILWKLEQN
jgi:tRNA C32,U32 (ribose-2'-O)-methylase TrmJ